MQTARARDRLASTAHAIVERWLKPPADASLPARVVDAASKLAAAVLFASLFVAACHDVSKAYDGWFYHLPFAARLAGIVDANEYAFGRANTARFQGFPLAAEVLQGIAWRVTGRIECANLVAFAALPGLAYALRRLFAVPPHLTFLALLAIPLVQIHATASYVDLPANASAAVLCLIAYRAIVAEEPPSVRSLALGAALAAFTANAKFQLVPVVALSALCLVVRAARGDGRRKRLLLVLAATPIVFFTPLKNLVVYGNPVWPIELTILGHAFPRTEGAYASSPVWLEHVPRQLRFACSVLEIGMRPIAEHARWSLDQWTPPSHPAYRMGGFFGAYVVANLVALVVAAVRHRTRESRRALAFFGGLTLVVSSLPQSHELRYYMVWMIVLVALNLVLWSKRAGAALGLGAASALAIVSWSTGGTYLYASGDSFRTLVTEKVDARAISTIGSGERVCVSRAPWTFLYASRFHDKRWSVQEAEDLSDCAGARPLD